MGQVPKRSMSTIRGLEWERGVPAVAALSSYFQRVADGDPIPLSDVLPTINAIPETRNKLFNDRRQFLLYWSQRALETFGDDAMIEWNY